MDDLILAIRGGDHELVRGVSADGTALRLNRQEIQAAAREDAAVRAIDLLVRVVQRFERRVKAVRILHQELARAEDTEPRTLLVPKLDLDLIHRQRQLAIAADVLRDQIGHDLLVRRPESQMDGSVAPLHVEVDQHIAKRLAAAGSLEEVDRLESGHENFDGPGGVHLLPDDGLGLFECPQSERQVRVGSRHELPDQTGSQHQLMTGNFRIGGDFLHGRNERLRPAHGRLLSRGTQLRREFSSGVARGELLARQVTSS